VQVWASARTTDLGANLHQGQRPQNQQLAELRLEAPGFRRAISREEGGRGFGAGRSGTSVTEPVSIIETMSTLLPS